MDESSDRLPATPKNDDARAKEAQRRYEQTQKGQARAQKYNKSEKGRARKRKYTYLMTPEQAEKQREAKRLSAQKRRAKQKQNNLQLPLDNE